MKKWRGLALIFLFLVVCISSSYGLSVVSVNPPDGSINVYPGSVSISLSGPADEIYVNVKEQSPDGSIVEFGTIPCNFHLDPEARTFSLWINPIGGLKYIYTVTHAFSAGDRQNKLSAPFTFSCNYGYENGQCAQNSWITSRTPSEGERVLAYYDTSWRTEHTVTLNNDGPRALMVEGVVEDIATGRLSNMTPRTPNVKIVGDPKTFRLVFPVEIGKKYAIRIHKAFPNSSSPYYVNQNSLKKSYAFSFQPEAVVKTTFTLKYSSGPIRNGMGRVTIKGPLQMGPSNINSSGNVVFDLPGGTDYTVLAEAYGLNQDGQIRKPELSALAYRRLWMKKVNEVWDMLSRAGYITGDTKYSATSIVSSISYDVGVIQDYTSTTENPLNKGFNRNENYTDNKNRFIQKLNEKLALQSSVQLTEEEKGLIYDLLYKSWKGYYYFKLDNIPVTVPTGGTNSTNTYVKEIEFNTGIIY